MTVSIARTQHLINLCRSSESLQADSTIATAIANKNGDAIESRLRELAGYQDFPRRKRIRLATQRPGVLTTSDAASLALALLAAQSNQP